MPCTITPSTARSPTRYRQTTDKIQRQSSAPGVRREKTPWPGLKFLDRVSLGQARDDLAAREAHASLRRQTRISFVLLNIAPARSGRGHDRVSSVAWTFASYIIPNYADNNESSRKQGSTNTFTHHPTSIALQVQQSGGFTTWCLQSRPLLHRPPHPH